MRISVACAAVALLAIAGCSVAPGEVTSMPPPSESASTSPAIAASASASAAPPAPSSSGAQSPATTATTAATASTASSAGSSARSAAEHLLRAEAADVDLVVERQKRPTDPVETLVTGTGRVEPVRGRGHWTYDVSGLFAPPAAATPRPGASSAAPDPAAPSAPLNTVELIWTPADMYVRVADTKDGAWDSRSREDGRQTGGLIGRLPDEPLGLLTLVANSDPSHATQLDRADLGGAAADRWNVTIPVEEATAAGVPAEMPDADSIRNQYGITELPVEVWLVDGSVRRLRVALHRDSAPYGGPDTTTTTYDWRPAHDNVPVEVPE